MLPVIALVGRPNVGKSTLFNCLTRSRNALVANTPGLTRDRLYGVSEIGSRACVVVDTGGLSGDDAALDGLVARQAWLAINESDAILFLVDGRAGMTAADEDLALRLRRLEKPLLLVVNKTEHLDAHIVSAEFHALGLGPPQSISASHNRGVSAALNFILDALPAESDITIAGESLAESDSDAISMAIVGRPNVGKSTLVNRLLGEERVLTFDSPGTTRDSVSIPFERDRHKYLLIDTAGVRRRSRVHETIEKFSVIKTLQAIEQANVVVMVLDARQGIGEQDATLLGLVLESGRALVLAVNKWDGLAPDTREAVKRELERKLSFMDFAKPHFISALHGSGVMDVLKYVRQAYASASRHLPTPELTRILENATARHQPPLVFGHQVKLRYAHQGGRNPPTIIIHGNRTEHVPETYRRYLANVYREALRLVGTPVRIQFKGGDNPYRPATPTRRSRASPVRKGSTAKKDSRARRR